MTKMVPFYENPDTTHCFQAVLRMILKYYVPDREYTWAELDKITAKKEGFWTWQTAGLLWLDDNGFEVKSVEGFDNERFVREAEQYLVKRFGAEVAREQISHSDITQEVEYAKRLTTRGLCQVLVPTLDDLKQRVDEGWLLICNVNSRMLNGLEGYVGHFVLVTGYDGDGLILHDPGRQGTGESNRHVSIRRFSDAWSYPTHEVCNYMAVRRAM